MKNIFKPFAISITKKYKYVKEETMEHSFNIELAKKYGIVEAILLKNLWFWIAKNKANEKHFYDGTYWTYNSIKAFGELFPYISEKTIIRSLKKLEELGIIKTGNYNKIAYDRTKWYAFTSLGNSIMTKGQMEDTKTGNGIDENSKAIPDINTNINTNNITNAEIIKCYEENIGLITPATAEILFSYNDIDYKLIIEAIKIASVNNKRNCRYIQGILNSWINKGYKVLSDIQQEQEEKQKTKKVEEHKETKEETIERWKKEWGLTDED